MSSLILYSRHACHLCEVMQVELQPLLEEFHCEVVIQDVDSRPEWQQLYGHLLPVLETDDGKMICNFHLDEDAVRSWLTSQTG